MIETEPITANSIAFILKNDRAALVTTRRPTDWASGPRVETGLTYDLDRVELGNRVKRGLASENQYSGWAREDRIVGLASQATPIGTLGFAAYIEAAS